LQGCILIPIQEPTLSLKGADSRNILAYFQGAPVLALSIVNGEVPDVDKCTAQFKPEFRHLLLFISKGLHNSLNNMDTFGRVAVGYIPANDARTPWEDPFRVIRIVEDPIILIYKGYINGKIGRASCRERVY
jgi:hypothetical protein